MKIKNRSKRVANRYLFNNWSRKAHRSAKLAFFDQEEFRRNKKQNTLIFVV